MFQRPTVVQVAEVFGAFNFQNVLKLMQASDWTYWNGGPHDVSDLVDVCIELFDSLLRHEDDVSVASGGFKVTRENMDGGTVYGLEFTYDVFSGLGKGDA